jgi:GH25 family lysozyme M1 (1,4-beta-N-acetylmuramidase)
VTLFVPDISHHQAGIDIHALKSQGAAALIARVGQGAGRRTNGQNYSTTRDREWVRHRDEARRVGLPLVAYWYVGNLISADENARLAADWAGDKAIPWMIDHEDASGSLTYYCQVVDAFRRRGLRVILGYVPRWYWDAQGRGDLSCGPPLVNSRYSNATGTPASIYMSMGGDAGNGWPDFGGQNVLLWQFTNKGQMAGRPIDVSAFRGTSQELLELINGTPEEDPMKYVLARRPAASGDPRVWAGNGITRVHVRNEQELADRQWNMEHELGLDPTVHEWDNVEVLGVDLSTALANLADDEVKIIDAVRLIVAADADADVTLSEEQLAQLADAVVQAVPPHVQEAVRQAFARAGSPEVG